MTTPSPVSLDISDILSTNGVGTLGANTGWGIFVSREPDSPDTAITIFDSGNSLEPNAKWLLEYPSFQVRVRGSENNYLSATAKIQEIKDVLLGLPPQTRNGTNYRGVWQQTEIIPLGYDDQNRPLLVQNYRTVREPTSTGTNRIPLST